MILQKIFEEYGYCDITNKEDAEPYELLTEIFYEDDHISEELKYLYISKTRDELFLVLDGRNRNIKELCKKWDQKISIFIAFGSDQESVTQKIKYNVVQIILFEGSIDDRSEEGSLNVSRKILLPCTITEEGYIDIPDTETVEIPFYIVPVGDFEVNVNIKDHLKRYVPNSNAGNLSFLNEPIKKASGRKNSNHKIRKTFSEDQFGKIKEWINSYDHPDNSNQ